jgi:hypothetical protein
MVGKLDQNLLGFQSPKSILGQTLKPYHFINGITLELGELIQYSDQAMGWTSSRQEQEISTAACSNWLWDPQNLLTNEHQGLFPRSKATGV